MKWSINITDLQGGFAPGFYKESYPSYGNKNQAGAMSNIDITNPGFITQGPGLSTLTDGTEAGAVTTLIKGMTDYAVASDVAYGVGGAKLYKFSSTAVVNTGAWPHTIDKGAVTGEDGEDVTEYKGALYYTYNHSGSAGDIGKFDLNATFDDDWGSTVPSGMAALTNNPHPLCVGGNDVMYFGNGRYVGSYDGTTFQTQALDLPTGSVIVDLQWKDDRLHITSNNPNLSGSNRNKSYVYLWDGTTDSWELAVPLMGLAGASHVRNNVFYQTYLDISNTGGYKIAYLEGASVNDLAHFTGGLPSFYQTTDYKDFIIFSANGLIYALGAGDPQLPQKFFQLADAGFSTGGGLVSPFGTPITASTQSTSYKLAKFSGYDVNSSYKTLIFDIAGDGKVGGNIDNARINIESMATGASVAWKLLNNRGTTIFSDTISFAKNGASTSIYTPLNGLVADNFRVEFDFASGSATNPVKIKSLKINGTA